MLNDQNYKISTKKGVPNVARALVRAKWDKNVVYSLLISFVFISTILLMYYIYILKLRDNTFYHGFSANLRQRVRDHNDGNVPQTRKLRPLKLVYYSAFESKKKP